MYISQSCRYRCIVYMLQKMLHSRPQPCGNIIDLEWSTYHAVLDPTFHITQSVGLKSSQLRRYVSVCKFVEVSLIQKRLKSNHQINEVDMRGAQKAKPSHPTLLKIPLDNSWEACAPHMFNGPTYGTIAPQVLQPLLSTSASINRGPYCRDYRYSNQKQAFKQFQFLSSFFLQT